MSTPEFVLELRKKIGHDLLWLNGVTGCVLNEHGQLLLGRRSDTGEWAMVYGINEPGEQPADTVVREIKEETGIDAIVTDLVERLELFHTYIENKKHGDAHALFQFDGQQY